VRMVDQQIVRESFDLYTPQDARQTRYERFKAARDRAEWLGLIQRRQPRGVVDRTYWNCSGELGRSDASRTFSHDDGSDLRA
jgi:hypothetical protein